MSKTIARRIGSLVRLLSSCHAGEAAAAAEALKRAINSAGIDLHALSYAIEKAVAELPIQVRPRSDRSIARLPDTRPLQLNEKLICDQSAGLFAPCSCGGEVFTVLPGTGPHRGRLVCDACGYGNRWLGRKYFGDAS